MAKFPEVKQLSQTNINRHSRKHETNSQPNDQQQQQQRKAKMVFSTGEEKLENYSSHFLHSCARGPGDLNINQLICVCVEGAVYLE